jgi:hypothetical protein
MFTFLKRFLIALFVLVACSGFAAGDTVFNLGSGFVIPMANVLVIASDANQTWASNTYAMATDMVADYDKNNEWDDLATFTSSIAQTIRLEFQAAYGIGAFYWYVLRNGQIFAYGTNTPINTYGAASGDQPRISATISLAAGDTVSMRIFGLTVSGDATLSYKNLVIYRIK